MVRVKGEVASGDVAVDAGLQALGCGGGELLEAAEVDDLGLEALLGDVASAEERGASGGPCDNGLGDEADEGGGLAGAGGVQIGRAHV